MSRTIAEELSELVGHVEAYDETERVLLVLDATAAVVGIELAADYTSQDPEEAAAQFLEAFRTAATTLTERLQQVSPQITELVRARRVATPERRPGSTGPRLDDDGNPVKETVEEARMRRARAIEEYRDRRRADDERLERLKSALATETTARAFNDRVLLGSIMGRPASLRFDARWFAGASPRSVAEEILALCEDAARAHEEEIGALRRPR